MKNFLIIDTFNFLHRAYHALPITLTDSTGSPINAVYGVTSMLISVFETVKPDYVLAALDGEKPTFRVEEFTGYKAHRRPMEDDLSSQIVKVLAVLDAFGIPRVQVDGYEADDVIATCTRLLSKEIKEDLEIVIISNDRDLWQLLDDHVKILLPSNKKGQKAEWIDKAAAEEKLGIAPESIADYKALRGDPSDNIPGVFGVGAKGAIKLIEQFGSLEEIYKHIDEVEPESLKKKLADCTDQAFMSKHLATLIDDVPMELNLKDCKYHDFNKENVRRLLEEFRFKSLIKRLGFTDDEKSESSPPENQLGLFA